MGCYNAGTRGVAEPTTRVRLVVGKNRRGKKLGYADVLWQNEDGSYSDAKDWIVEDTCYTLNGEVVHRFENVEPPVLPTLNKIPEIKPLQNSISGLELSQELEVDEPF